MTPGELGASRIAPARPLPYTRKAEAGPDVWDVLREADGGDRPNTVRLLYSGYEIDAGERDGEYAAGWTREHVWPRSRGGMATSPPGMGTDAHNLFAADTSVNSARSNKDFDAVPDGEPVVDRSPAPGHDGRLLARQRADAWEPPDASKGAVARALMYMACAYADRLELVDRRSGGAPGQVGVLGTLLGWHRAFPPTDRERRRNDAVERAQGNRNPFVDEPGLADGVRWATRGPRAEKDQNIL